MNKALPLAEAVSSFVKPGMHLCFASTPSRSNAAVREIGRQFRSRKPEFELSATGFHSLLHLLGLLRLGRLYRACFFGDNYPSPRPNRLYGELLREGYELEHWSLWSYVSALAAGAFGHPYALTRSLLGTSLGAALSEKSKLLQAPDPADPKRRLGLLRAITPDITFLHAPLGDAHGNVVFAPPHGEGFYGALAARSGVIVTVERVVASDIVTLLPHFVPLPAYRVLAVCEEPFGAHPQPLHVSSAELRTLEPGYSDDYAGYDEWRHMTGAGRGFSAFSQRVLDAPDGSRGYREFVGQARLDALRRSPSSRPPAAPLAANQLEPVDDLVLLAGRALARRLARGHHHSLLAGIGQAFAACRLAKLLLKARGEQIELMVETGFAGLDPLTAHPFLLSRENVASAARLTSVDGMLGALCCGGVTACLGVIGAAEVDEGGNVNSSLVDGEPLVGAGGAPDIAACASEVMVLTRADPRRLVRKVQYLTSLGHNVRSIATEACVFERAAVDEPWVARDVIPSRLATLGRRLEAGGFHFVMTDPASLAPPPTAYELELLTRIRPTVRQTPAASEAPNG